MITSVKNDKVKTVKKLHKRKERMKTEKFLIEGFHLMAEAHQSAWEIEEIIAEETVLLPSWCQDYPITWVSASVFTAISETQTPQGIAAVVKMKHTTSIQGNRVLLIDAVQDPGNLGTMIRTADAAGFAGVILGEGTVDLYNDKVIRSTQGSLFHFPVVQANLQDKMNELKNNGFVTWATALEGAEDYHDLRPHDKVAVIFGNEGAGVSPELLAASDERVKIPIYGQAESLNVSIAAGIIMYYLQS